MSETSYDLITKDIKEKCRYYKILNHNGTDYVTYSCSESSYKGKIGFVIIEGREALYLILFLSLSWIGFF